MRVQVQLGPGHEVFVPTNTRDLPSLDAVRHHLAVEVHRQGTVDGHQVRVLEMTVGSLTVSTG